MHSIKSLGLIVFTAALISACSSNPQRDILTEQEYYREAREAIEDNNMLVAEDRLNRLESQYPFGKYAEQAQLELIYVHFRMADMESVLAQAERFIRLHPLHAQVDYAYYMRGLATYEMGFAFVERYFGDGTDKRNPVPLQDSFAYFDELIKRFPDSAYNTDARARMIYLRERLASYQMEIARYYMKRHAYLAAANRGEEVLTHYQKTHAVADALAIMTEAYELLGLTEESEKALALLTLNHPDHPQLESGTFESSGLTEVDRRSFWNIVSFGLID
ncbi:outer membrane protein assembly factor BamD [Thalassolituus sp.]|uniref:outer membrane protein assembly factor BamD n=1 Tax=Thalassolituus sp. TaxID=2030822 RepID=UPI0035154C84|nr:MAG: outer membrane protein assembly factor BamD [Thalassolituus sp.]